MNSKENEQKVVEGIFRKQDCIVSVIEIGLVLINIIQEEEVFVKKDYLKV